MKKLYLFLVAFGFLNASDGKPVVSAPIFCASPYDDDDLEPISHEELLRFHKKSSKGSIESSGPSTSQDLSAEAASSSQETSEKASSSAFAHLPESNIALLPMDWLREPTRESNSDEVRRARSRRISQDPSDNDPNKNRLNWDPRKLRDSSITLSVSDWMSNPRPCGPWQVEKDETVLLLSKLKRITEKRDRILQRLSEINGDQNPEASDE